MREHGQLLALGFLGHEQDLQLSTIDVLLDACDGPSREGFLQVYHGVELDGCAAESRSSNAGRSPSSDVMAIAKHRSAQA